MRSASIGSATRIGEVAAIPAMRVRAGRDEPQSTSRAAERITLEIETLGAELEGATARLNDLQLTERPIRITKKLVNDTIAQFEGILKRAPLETRVATVRDLFERVDVDSRELKAVAVWNMTTDQGVNRSDAVSEWLRRQDSNLRPSG